MESLDVATRVAISSWKQITNRIDEAIAAMDEERAGRQVAPGRNRIAYLVGHLAAVHDRMFPLLGLGDRAYATLDKPFLEDPDGPGAEAVPFAEVRKAWSDVHSRLTAAIEALEPQQWLERHTAVSEEDFAKEPLRNRLAVLLSRTNHASYHEGQMKVTSKE